MGTSSARPDDLDAWARVCREQDEAVRARLTTLVRLHGEFRASLGWGHFDASSLLWGCQQWLDLNDVDGQWVSTIAGEFRQADAGTVPDAVIEAGIRSAGVDSPRVSVTFDDPIALGEPATSGYADDPVNTANGNFVETEVDLVANGLVRLLRFVRTYNSRSDRVGPFGPGWASWASCRLRAEPAGAAWEGPDGQRALIPRVSDGIRYERVVGIDGLVVPDGDGLAIDWFGGGRLVFDRDGRPLVAEDGPGTEVRFHHEGDRLAGLGHAGGKALTLRWEGERIVGLDCSDGRAVAYGYDDDGRLVEVDGPGGVRRYDVDDRGRIVAVVDADGVVEVRNRYDDEGRVVGQVSPHGRRSRYRYLPGRVTMVGDDAGGPVNSYVHDSRGRLVGVVDGHGAELVKTYDRWGNPAVVIDRNGARTTQDWDERARLVRRVTPNGASFSFAYDDQDRVTEVTARPAPSAASRPHEPASDEAGPAADDNEPDGEVSVGLATPDAAVTRYRYEGDERSPAEIVDPAGGITRLTVEGGLVRRIVDPDGVELRFGFDADGNLAAVTDAAGNTAAIERDAAGRPLATVSPGGLRTRFVYDDRGRPIERRDPGGGVWRFEWSDAGRLAAMVDPAGARIETRYGANGEAEQIVDPLGQVTSRRFDPLGNLVGLVEPDGAKWELTYDALSRLTGVHDPTGGAWLREYDEVGHLVGSIDPTGVHRTATVDRSGRVTGLADPATSIGFAYDGLGRAVGQRRADGSELRATYDRAGRVTSVTDPEGGVTRYEHTAAGRLAAVTSPMGAVTHYEHDHLGRQVAVIDPLGQRWSQRYDGDGRITQVVAPTGESERFRYDSAGRLAARVTSAGGTTRYGYDAAGRVVEVTDAGGGATRYQWDLRDQLSEVVDPTGGVTRYERDARGFLRTLVDPLGGHVEHDYDELGRLVVRRDQLRRATYWDYDPAGRLVGRALPSGERVRWWYDDAGRLSSVGTGDEPRVRIERDPLGRPVAIEEPELRHELDWDGLDRLIAKRRGGLELAWRYDADGRRIVTRYPDGSETTVEHDPAGRPTSATHPAVGTVRFEHDAAGRLVGRSSSSGSERWRYGGGLLASYGAARPGRRHVTELERDPAGRVVAATTDDVRTTYAYDQAGQLVAADAPDGTWGFRYDAAGRLVGETGPGGEVGYRYDAAHQLLERSTSDTATHFSYDAAGRRIAETATSTVPPGGKDRSGAATGGHSGYPGGPAGLTFSWDWLGRLSGLGDTRLRVDALGDLAEVDGRALLWDPTDAIPQPRWFDGTAVVGDHEPWATVDPTGTPTWLDHDWQGSITTPAGAGAGFDPWGATVDGSGAGQPGLGYRGELTVDGLLWLRNRAYDPTTRGFLAVDPLPGIAGQPFAANPYHYAGNNPVGALDPFGLRPMTDADLVQYREAASRNLLDRTGDWVGDNWEYVAAGVMVAGGIALMATGVGGPAGVALIGLGGAALGGGASVAIQKATTGQVNWAQVGVDAAIGGLAGGTGAAFASSAAVSRVATTTVARGAVAGLAEGAVSGTAYQGVNYARTGQFDPSAIARDTLLGGGLGAAGAGLGRAANAAPASTHQTITPTDLYAFGNKAGPRPPRASDFEIDANGGLLPQEPPLPHGASTFADPQQAPLSGQYHRLPGQTQLREGLAVVADGSDVVPASPNPPGHHTIYPTREMSLDEFQQRFGELPWEHAGKKK